MHSIVGKIYIIHLIVFYFLHITSNYCIVLKYEFIIIIFIIVYCASLGRMVVLLLVTL